MKYLQFYTRKKKKIDQVIRPNLSERPSNLRVFTYAELKQATRYFTRPCKLGEDGFRSVFQGVTTSSDYPAEKLDIAVKDLGSTGLEGDKEWVKEVNVLGIAEHPNLVKLIGYCAEDGEREIQQFIIYEYMPNRSVDDHLSAKTGTHLSWDMRLKIAQDVARGLTYLHDFQIIFRNFKSSNILLDEQWNAKLSNFGLARLYHSEGLGHGYHVDRVVETRGYAAPEYVLTGRLTSKSSEVWSYGVFLLELITGRRPYDRNRPRGEQKLLEWIRPYLSDTKKFQQIIDPRLEGEHILKSARKLSIVANRCLATDQQARPNMSEVLAVINQIVEASSEVSNGILVCWQP